MMKRMTLTICMLGLVPLAACDRTESAPINASTVEGKIRVRRGGERVRVWRDPETGCQYLLWERRDKGGMTPRLRPDGRPMCR